MKTVKTFNMTAKRIEALKFVQQADAKRTDRGRFRGVLVGYLAQNVLASNDEYWQKLHAKSGGRRHLWAQAATRMGAGYCKPLVERGLLSFHREDVGYGSVTITEAGIKAIADWDAKNDPANQPLDVVIARCIE